MIRQRIAGLIFLVALATMACDRPKEEVKPRSIGKTSEILVVLDNQGQWDNSIGKAIRENFQPEQYGLPQSEPLFDVAHLNKRSFSDMFKKHRNLLIVEIDPKLKKGSVETFEDYWAKPQEIVRIKARDSHEFVKLLNEHAPAIIEKYNQAERKRILTVYRPSSRNKATDKLVKAFHLKMTIPEGFFVAKTEKDFIWIRKEANDYSQGIIVFGEPYIDTAQFSVASITARTNRFLMQYVPGEFDSTFMQVDEEFVPAKARVVNDFVTDYAVEVRGLWRVKGDFMGGPFLSYTFVDPRDNHIVTLYGYVYHPNKKKRDLLRQLEAILYSTAFVD